MVPKNRCRTMGVRYSEALVLDTTECFFKFSSVANILGIAFSEVKMFVETLLAYELVPTCLRTHTVKQYAQHRTNAASNNQAQHTLNYSTIASRGNDFGFARKCKSATG